MRFYTTVDIAPSPKKIGYDDKLVLLGSCFADNIGAKFREYYFQATVSPFGTLYNPASIANAILDSLHSNDNISLLYHNGLWHSMSHHGAFSNVDKTELDTRCIDSINNLKLALLQASTIMVTFGTAWVYEMDGKVVANCHKLPARMFTRRRMSAEEIVALWQPIIDALPGKHWVFTVSPIRHVKDGLHENQLSKAILLQAIDQLANLNSQLSYFPAYEIVLDELRDYRFYAEDMVHPSAVAVDYMWQRFVANYMSDSTQDEMRVLHQLWLDRRHRCLHPDTEDAKLFQKQIAERLRKLQQRYPWLY